MDLHVSAPSCDIASPRRSRMHRKSSGKRIELSARDIEIFKLLDRYRYLRSTFLHAFVGGASETRFKERLGDLYHDGRYLDRPSQQWQSVDARYMPAVYELDDNGKVALKERDIARDSAVELGRRGKPGDGQHFRHALMICEVLASIELGTRNAPDVRFVPWQEICAKAPKNALRLPARIAYTSPRTGKSMAADVGVVPDALFGIEYKKPDGSPVYRFFALEVERCNRVDCTNLVQTSWLKKFLAYRDIAARKVHASALGLPNLMVLGVATSPAHIKSMKSLVMDISDGGGSSLFLFRAFPDGRALPVPELFTQAWERAGRQDFRIDRV